MGSLLLHPPTPHVLCTTVKTISFKPKNKCIPFYKSNEELQKELAFCMVLHLRLVLVLVFTTGKKGLKYKIFSFLFVGVFKWRGFTGCCISVLHVNQYLRASIQSRASWERKLVPHLEHSATIWTFSTTFNTYHANHRILKSILKVRQKCYIQEQTPNKIIKNSRWTAEVTF